MLSISLKTKVFAALLVTFFLVIFGAQSLLANSSEEDEINQTTLINAVRAAAGPHVDVYLEIVKNLLKVKKGRLSPEKFYRRVAKLQMPEGKELRHVLMEVKKDIGNWKGEKGLTFVFGDIYASGATDRLEQTNQRV